MTLLLPTLLVQVGAFVAALVAALVPKFLRRRFNSAIGFVAVVFGAVHWFPECWSGMELISFAYLAGFLLFEILIYVFLMAGVYLLRQAHEAASGH